MCGSRLASGRWKSKLTGVGRPPGDDNTDPVSLSDAIGTDGCCWRGCCCCCCKVWPISVVSSFEVSQPSESTMSLSLAVSSQEAASYRSLLCLRLPTCQGTNQELINFSSVWGTVGVSSCGSNSAMANFIAQLLTVNWTEKTKRMYMAHLNIEDRNVNIFVGHCCMKI